MNRSLATQHAEFLSEHPPAEPQDGFERAVFRGMAQAQTAVWLKGYANRYVDPTSVNVQISPEAEGGLYDFQVQVFWPEHNRWSYVAEGIVWVVRRPDNAGAYVGWASGNRHGHTLFGSTPVELWAAANATARGT